MSAAPKPPKKFKLPVLRFDVAAAFLNSRNVREKYMLFAFAGVFLFTLDYFLWLAPVLKTYTKAAPQIFALREERKSLKEDLKNQALIQRKWEEAKKDIGDKDLMFISPDETPALLENLSKEAQKTGVRITSLEPSEKPEGNRSKKGHVPLPIRLEANAGTHELGAFLSNLETGKTFFRVTNLKIMENPSNDRRHVVELSMEAYKREK